MNDFTIELRGAHNAMAQMRELVRKMPGALELATRQQAEIMRKQIIDGIRNQAPAGKPMQGLSRLTIALRKARGFDGTKALIRTGAFVRAIVVERVSFATYFVGVIRGTEDSRGNNAADIAAINEYGRTIVVRVTPKMRAFLMAALRLAGELGHRDPSQGGIRSGPITQRYMVIRIPPRPTITPIFAEAKKNPQRIQAEIQTRFMHLIGYSAR